MPWAGILYPTTDQKLLEMIQGKDKTVKSLHKEWYKTSPDIIKLAQFILDYRTGMKFRLQQKYAIFYSNKNLAQLLIETFWNHWYGTKSINPKYNKLGKNTVGCRRLPHGKFQFQVHLKKDVHQLITTSERENLGHI